MIKISKNQEKEMAFFPSFSVPIKTTKHPLSVQKESGRGKGCFQTTGGKRSWDVVIIWWHEEPSIIPLLAEIVPSV